ncbi:hypothetical protein TNCV_3656731 [Trichonephila clavipes]|nr:hypothetical protein TNCV_3656731 [Trichonephila clavipes]
MNPCILSNGELQQDLRAPVYYGNEYNHDVDRNGMGHILICTGRLHPLYYALGARYLHSFLGNDEFPVLLGQLISVELDINILSEDLVRCSVRSQPRTQVQG